MKLELNYKRDFVQAASLKRSSSVVHYLREHVFAKGTEDVKIGELIRRQL